MTEGDAKAVLRDRIGVSRETFEMLAKFVQLVSDENHRQNLVSANTIEHIWSRHILDSAQLVQYPCPQGDGLDLGSGAGFPGIVLAILQQQPIILVEPRRKRVEFLEMVIDSLTLRHARVYAGQIESMPTTSVAVITARAFAPLPKLFQLATRFSCANTVWLLPKGKSAHVELALARKMWHGTFRVEQSLSDPGAGIIVAQNVQPRGLQ